MKNLLFIFFIFTLFSCKQKAIINVQEIPADGIILNKWQVLGPFSSNKQNHYIEINNLALFGLKESDISFQDFINISKKIAKDTRKLDSCFSNKYIFSGDLPLDFNKMYNVSKEKFAGNVYCTCLIKCKKDISTRLHFASSAGEKIWLNNKLVCSVDVFKYLTAYEQFIPVDLKKGDNFLLIKVTKLSNNDWDMYARFENFSETGIRRHFEIHNHNFLNNSVLHGKDSISLDISFPHCRGEIIVLDRNKNILFADSMFENKHWVRSISSFNEGIYSAKIKIGNISLKQDFYIGDIIDSTQKIIRGLQTIETTDKIKNNTNPTIVRFNFLLKKTYSNEWIDKRKLVEIFNELNSAYTHLKNGKDPYYHTSGCFIRSYTSNIDNSNQYYILHVPSSYNRNVPSPTMAIIPTNGGKLPYLESFRVANLGLINIFQDLSEKYNMIIIEAGSRHFDKVIFNTIEETELFDIIKDVETDYTINPNRLYLSSACSGGNDVLKLAVKYPDRFAAVGLISPSVQYYSDTENLWMQYNTPVNFVSNIISMSIIDIHSKIDRHVSIESSDHLNRIAKDEGLRHFEYKKLPAEFQFYYTDAFFDDVFDFCSKYTLNPSPKEIDFTTSQMLYNKSFWITLNEIKDNAKSHIYAKIKGNILSVQKENITSYLIDLKSMPYDRNKTLKIIDNGTEVFKGISNDSVLYIGTHPKINSITKTNVIAGPLAHVFAQKFIVVKGTSGCQTEKKGISAMADTINKYWNDRYFSSCIIKNDFEISEKDIAEANLVLLGNYGSNLLISNLQDKIPLKMYNNVIQINNKIMRGENLCFYMIYPNPLNKNKYIAIIGYNNPQHIFLGSENSNSFNDVSNYGWYDYKVWEADKMITISSGYFNHKWEVFR
jgi:hypothetical protein